MVAIIDYGASNLRSVQKAFEYLNKDVIVTSDEQVILSADRLVLPGNGAFGDCMDALKSQDLYSAINKFIETERPFLGICVGMQLLFEKSLEFGIHEGFGFIDGVVRRFPDNIIEQGMKIPHIGWNTVTIEQQHKLFDNVEDNSYFYFVHSYYADNNNGSEIVGTCDYGETFAAVAVKDNIMGTQFHPEKSQKAGLQMLENFCKI